MRFNYVLLLPRIQNQYEEKRKNEKAEDKTNIQLYEKDCLGIMFNRRGRLCTLTRKQNRNIRKFSTQCLIL